jgi:hypothetical protein
VAGRIRSIEKFNDTIGNQTRELIIIIIIIMTFIICILLCVIQEKYINGTVNTTNIQTGTNYILQFICADVNATYFDLSLGHLQAYMKQ